MDNFNEKTQSILFCDGTTRNKNGVAIIVTNIAVKLVKYFIFVSDKIVLLQISCKLVNLNIVQVYVYTTTCDSVEEKKKQFYGDFNAKVAQRINENITRERSLGMRSDRGGRLIQFCQEK